MQWCEAPLIRGMVRQEQGVAGFLRVKREGIGQGVVQPEFDGQVQGRHTLLVRLVIVEGDEAAGGKRDKLLTQVLRLVLEAIILEQGEKVMQDGVAVLISDSEG